MTFRKSALGLLCYTALATAVPQEASGVSLGTGVPSLTLTTSIPSATVAADTKIPSQAALPPKQAWCPSEIFCAGDIIQSIDLAQVFVDSKTYVDKPTKGTSNETLTAFNTLVQSKGGIANLTEGDIIQFLDNDYSGEGLELQAIPLPSFNPTPQFLGNVSDPLLKAWMQTVHGFWTSLIRSTNSSTLCTGGKCESTLIPLNHTFVVPGGRFREQYYWDSYFIVEGLIKSELFDIVNSTLQNFMDEIEKFGFIPNGGRIYYLNRSQPPLFIHMLSNYVAASGDKAILNRALQLAEAELQFWQSNRTISIKSPFTNQTHQVAHYSVDINSAPRPESYLEDYQTIYGAGGGDIAPNLTATEAADLFAELASGAETGWDYSSRWMKDPTLGNTTFTLPALRTLDVRNTTPVDLNSILYNAHVLLADLYDQSNASDSSTLAESHRTNASTLRTAILDLFWDPTKLAFYDFNRTSNGRNSLWTTATFYPLWAGIIPDEVLADSTGQKAFGLFSAVNLVLNKYNGTVPVTMVETGQQWDWPNTWPPHQYIILNALRNLPSNLTSKSLPQPASNQTTFNLIPSGQLGPISSSGQLFPEAKDGGGSFPVGVDVNKADQGMTVLNGGNATQNEGWANTLLRELSNRYVTSAYCNWLATGGSIPGVVSRLPDSQLNITQAVNNTGIMFEKFSVLDVDQAGVGGEYTVQAGFGWTNGVVLWVGGEFGNNLATPVCPKLEVAAAAPTSTSPGGSGGGGKSGAEGLRGVFGWGVVVLAGLVGGVLMV
ncbi:glycoside hydrolase family 37 protein [Sphaerobolus stellatus SS14]|nr:glycoside hydrolase family 37 protein [Sphaerobolus stellatus SS14]